jgi:lysyl-tRNA synthetase, class II
VGEHGPQPETVNGRVQSVRMAGNKLYFLTLRGEFEEIQAVVEFSALQKPFGQDDPTNKEEFKALAKDFQRGDHVCMYMLLLVDVVLLMPSP